MIGDAHGPAEAIGGPDSAASIDSSAQPGSEGDQAPQVPTGRPQPRPPAQPPSPPQTGDAELDAAMSELARAQQRSVAERIDSGERMHRLLQGRLGDLGGA